MGFPPSGVWGYTRQFATSHTWARVLNDWTTDHQEDLEIIECDSDSWRLWAFYLRLEIENRCTEER